MAASMLFPARAGAAPRIPSLRLPASRVPCFWAALLCCAFVLCFLRLPPELFL